MRTWTVLVALGFAAGGQAVPPVEILRTGSFHGDEVRADAAGPWFALVSEADGASLLAVRVKVVSEHDAIVDGAREKTGKRVETSPRVDAVALLRGLRSLKAGRLPTAIGERNFQRGDGVNVHLGDRAYQVSFECAAGREIEGQSTCEVKLASGSAGQSLFTYRSTFLFDDEWHTSGTLDTPMIVWAGDLDGDGRLDILLNTSDNDNVGEMRLYLSSRADAAHLVSEVARFTHVGC